MTARKHCQTDLHEFSAVKPTNGLTKAVSNELRKPDIISYSKKEDFVNKNDLKITRQGEARRGMA